MSFETQSKSLEDQLLEIQKQNKELMSLVEDMNMKVFETQVHYSQSIAKLLVATIEIALHSQRIAQEKEHWSFGSRFERIHGLSGSHSVNNRNQSS